MTLDELSDMCSGESPGLDGIPPHDFTQPSETVWDSIL